MKKAIITGSGIGGIATSIRLQIMGYQVQVFEKNDYPGGKLTQYQMKGYRFDAGPSLFTLPTLVDELFQLAGKKPEEHFQYQKLDIITKYFYPDGTVINAWQDPLKFAEEMEAKTEEDKDKILEWLAKSRDLYGITHHVFLERSLHRLDTYFRWPTLLSALKIHKLDAFRTMATANRQQFADSRTSQLFDRYATYNGSNPYEAPATLNIIPHLEHNIGAYFPEKGMHEITMSLVKLAKELGVGFFFGQAVEKILVDKGKATGIQVNGQTHEAKIVVSNADVVPTYRYLLSDQPAPEKVLNQPRSSSALIFYWGIDREFPELDLHNIFFSADYKKEFSKMWEEKTIDDDPTVYLYISCKRNPEDAPPGGENWFTMINVPSDQGQVWDHLIEEARKNIIKKLSKMLGCEIEKHIVSQHILEPRTIASLTSSHQGALYGNSSNNRFAAFQRHPNFHPKIEGLYFCGGSVHPGGGIPLCLLSAKIIADLIAKA